MKPGYKQTDIGVIPEEWDVLPLKEVLMCAELGGNYPNSETPSDFPLMKMGNVGRGLFNLTKIEFVSNGVIPMDKHRLRYMDIIFNTRNTLDLVGKVAIWRDERDDAYFNSNLMRLSFDPARISSKEYANLTLNTDATLSRLRAIATGTTSVAAIYTRDLLKSPVMVPPPPEQRAIAEALSDVDAAIHAQGRLIAKKRALRTGAMQRLLTGQTRLPGFTAPWHVKRLGDCLVEPPRYGINAPSVPYSTYLPKYIRITDISDDGRFFPRPLVCVSAESDRYLLCSGDLVFARTGASVGKSYLYDARDGELIYAGFLIRVRPDPTQLVSKFLAGVTTSRSYWNWVKLMSMRTGQPGINGQEYAQLEFSLPPVEEQTAIARALTDIDAEITVLEARREKTRALKQAMMQALLTGRVRLPVAARKESPEAEAAHA